MEMNKNGFRAKLSLGAVMTPYFVTVQEEKREMKWGGARLQSKTRQL